MHGFEVGQQYQNRNGSYTVLKIDERSDKMLIEYEDRTKKTVGISLAWRIYQNVRIDQSDSGQSSQRKRGKSARKTAQDSFAFWDELFPLISKRLSQADEWVSVPDLQAVFLQTDNGKRLLQTVQQRRQASGMPNKTDQNIAINMVAFFQKLWTEGDEELRARFDRLEQDGVRYYRLRR